MPKGTKKGTKKGGRFFAIIGLSILLIASPVVAITLPSTAKIVSSYTGVVVSDFQPLDDSTGGDAADTLMYLEVRQDRDTSVVWGPNVGAHLWTKLSMTFWAIGNDTAAIAAIRDSNNCTIYAIGSNDGARWYLDDSFLIVSDTTIQKKVFTLNPWKYRALMAYATAAKAFAGKLRLGLGRALYYGVK